MRITHIHPVAGSPGCSPSPSGPSPSEPSPYRAARWLRRRSSAPASIAWYVDASSNRLVDRTAGVFTQLISAGDAIYGGGFRCSLGFNVSRGSTFFFLTAGHF